MDEELSGMEKFVYRKSAKLRALKTEEASTFKRDQVLSATSSKSKKLGYTDQTRLLFRKLQEDGSEKVFLKVYKFQ